LDLLSITKYRDTANQQVMPDDHSKSVPPLPIPNRTVKRLRANDSAATSVKVGHRQAFIQKTPQQDTVEGFLLWEIILKIDLKR
jgi:hypothetical protein